MKKSSWLLAAVLALAAAPSWAALVVKSGEVRYQKDGVWVTATKGDTVPDGVSVEVLSKAADLRADGVTVQAKAGDSFKIAATETGALKISVDKNAAGKDTTIRVHVKGVEAKVSSGDVVIASATGTPITVVAGIVIVNGQTITAGNSYTPPQVAAASSDGSAETQKETSAQQEQTPNSPSAP